MHQRHLSIRESLCESQSHYAARVISLSPNECGSLLARNQVRPRHGETCMQTGNRVQSNVLQVSLVFARFTPRNDRSQFSVPFPRLAITQRVIIVDRSIGAHRWLYLSHLITVITCTVLLSRRNKGARARSMKASFAQNHIGGTIA